MLTPIHAATIIDTIVVGNTPVGIDINSQTNKVYVANQNDGTISVIDGNIDDVTDTIPVDLLPIYLAVNPLTNKIYVSNNGDDTVSVIDGTNNNILETIMNISNPYGIAVNSVTNKVYVSQSGSASVNTIHVIDGFTDTLVGNITVGFGPSGIAVNPVTNKVYVSNIHDGTISVINGFNDTVIDQIIVHSGPTQPLPGNDGIAVNSVTNKVYVANSVANSITVIDGMTDNIIETLSGFQGPREVTVNSVTNKVYVANTAGNTISIIDGFNNNIPENITVDNNPFDIAVNPETNKVYVSTAGGTGRLVFVIDDKVIDNVPPFITINSAIDGNGQSIANVTGETTSTSITFTLTAIDNENSIDGFECMMDNVVIMECQELNTNPATISLHNLIPGNHIFQVLAIDAAGNRGTPVSYIWTINPDNQQDVCDAAFPNINKLWPPNHDLRTIEIMGINNNNDNNKFTTSITKVLQDEPTMINAGDNSPDASILNENFVQLRAERDGNGDGRIYHIQFTVGDESGDICNGEVLVTVPHDMEKIAIDSAILYDSITGQIFSQ